MNAKIPAFVVYVKGISTSIVLKTKHVKFQLYMVHPDGVI